MRATSSPRASASLRREACFTWAHPDYCTTRLDHINYHFRQGAEHLWAYDFESLQAELRRAGFVRVTRQDFNPEYDTEERSEGTLYVRGVKP